MVQYKERSFSFLYIDSLSFTAHLFILISDVVAAKNFNIVQKQVAEMINGKTLVGHALQNDLKVSICSDALLLCTFYLYHLTDPDTV